jgi:hypothetical protein
MSPFFEKRSTLDRRLKKIEKELSSLDSNLRTLARKPEATAPAERLPDAGRRDRRPLVESPRDFSLTDGIAARPDSLRQESPVLAPGWRPDRTAGAARFRPETTPTPPSAGATVRPAGNAGRGVGLAEAARGRQPPRVDIRDERFTDYLAKNFQATRPLARERKVQRNKAIVVAIFVAIMFVLVMYRLFAI